jgi:hypothetical protein
VNGLSTRGLELIPGRTMSYVKFGTGLVALGWCLLLYGILFMANGVMINCPSNTFCLTPLSAIQPFHDVGYLGLVVSFVGIMFLVLSLGRRSVAQS